MFNLCGKCKFYKPLLNGQFPGECRRFPPQISKFLTSPTNLNVDVSFPPLPPDHPACAEYMQTVAIP